MFANIMSLGLLGLDGYIVRVETDLSAGLPAFDIVGLPDAAVKESRDRVRAALKNGGLSFPLSKVVINLAPADVKKTGPVYDLPIFMGILCASGQMQGSFGRTAFLGELSLNGELRPASGILPMLLAAKKAGIEQVFVPWDNAYEGGLVENLTVYGAKNASEVLAHIRGEKRIEPAQPIDLRRHEASQLLDFADVMGQSEAKRAMEIAAAGGHNLLLIGPPGSGKSMLAKRLPSILPDMSEQEILQTTKVYSIAGLLDRDRPLVNVRPFRSPHHTVSCAGLTGGGAIPRPGEISLAHNGVLFLDEFPEFARGTLEVLRQPIEDKTVTISRVAASLSYPCDFMLVCAMNPCPCGYYGHPSRQCICPKPAVSKYLSRISGPILDRLDLHVEVMPSAFDELSRSEREESSQKIKERVDRARAIQSQRYAGSDICCNAGLTPESLQKSCVLSEKARLIFKVAFEKLGLSARAYDRLLKVARTIADLDGSDIIEAGHISEAIQYRSLDRKYWAE